MPKAFVKVSAEKVQALLWGSLDVRITDIGYDGRYIFMGVAGTEVPEEGGMMTVQRIVSEVVRLVPAKDK